MIQNLSDDERIPTHIQTQIRDALTHFLISSLLSIGYNNVHNGRLDSASESAELLRDYFRLEEASEALYKYINLRKDREILFNLKNLQQQSLSNADSNPICGTKKNERVAGKTWAIPPVCSSVMARFLSAFTKLSGHTIFA